MASTTGSLRTRMATATTIIIEPGALHRLLAWLSPAYPVGGFSYSHGLEAAVEDGSVRDRAGLVAYVSAVLRAGAGRVDGALLAAAWRAAEAEDEAALDDTAELAAAWRGTAETALESLQQGAAFASRDRRPHGPKRASPPSPRGIRGASPRPSRSAPPPASTACRCARR